MPWKIFPLLGDFYFIRILIKVPQSQTDAAKFNGKMRSFLDGKTCCKVSRGTEKRNTARRQFPHATV